MNDSSPNDSMAGICVRIPVAEALVDEWRKDHDWTYKCGLPAHVTVRMPFPSEAPAAPDMLTSVLEEHLPLTATLARVEDREGALVVLIEPDRQLRALTDAIGEACPSLPPHRGGGEFSYHVTVVRTPQPGLRARVAQEIKSFLPMYVDGTELWRFDWRGRDLSVTWKARPSGPMGLD